MRFLHVLSFVSVIPGETAYAYVVSGFDNSSSTTTTTLQSSSISTSSYTVLYTYTKTAAQDVIIKTATDGNYTITLTRPTTLSTVVPFRIDPKSTKAATSSGSASSPDENLSFASLSSINTFSERGSLSGKSTTAVQLNTGSSAAVTPSSTASKAESVGSVSSSKRLPGAPSGTNGPTIANSASASQLQSLTSISNRFQAATTRALSDSTSNVTSNFNDTLSSTTNQALTKWLLSNSTRVSNSISGHNLLSSSIVSLSLPRNLTIINSGSLNSTARLTNKDNSTFQAFDHRAASTNPSLLSYGRSPQCTTSFESYYSSFASDHPLSIAPGFIYQFQDGHVSTGNPITFPFTQYSHDTCCGECRIYYPNVDVFYWDQPGADHSCVNLTGGPLEVHTFDLPGYTPDPKQIGGFLTNSIGETVADVIGIGTVPFVVPHSDPCSTCSRYTRPPPSYCTPGAHDLRCLVVDTGSYSTPTTKAPTKSGSLKPRAFALNNSINESFTPPASPSIYVVFNGVRATDLCGQIGSSLPAVTIAFAPGELSTLEGRLGADGLKTKPFDFKDLPCPPKSIADVNWYVPGPGNPYRPILDLPKKLLDFDPRWKNCKQAGYQGIDPPRALTPQKNMDPAVTVKDPLPLITPATPQLKIPTQPAPTNTPDANRQFDLDASKLSGGSNDPAGGNGNNAPTQSNQPVQNDPPTLNKPAQTDVAQNTDSGTTKQIVSPNDQAAAQNRPVQESQLSNNQPVPNQSSQGVSGNTNNEDTDNQTVRPNRVSAQNNQLAQNSQPDPISELAQAEPGQSKNGGSENPTTLNNQPAQSNQPSANNQPVQNNSPLQIDQSAPGNPSQENNAGGSGRAAQAYTGQGNNAGTGNPPFSVNGNNAGQSAAGQEVPGRIIYGTNQQQDNSQQGSPQQGSPQQGSPQQGSPQQGSPQQGSPQQGSPQQGSPQQGAPQQGTPQQGTPQQGTPQQGDSQQSTSLQGDSLSINTQQQNSAPEPAIIVQGQTISRNQPPVTIGGTLVIYSANSIYVGNSVAAAPIPQQVQPQQQQKQQQQSSPAPVAVGGYSLTPIPQAAGANSPLATAVQGQTISAGAAITIGGTPVINSAGSIYVGNDVKPIPTGFQDQAQQTQQQPQVPAPVAIAGYTFIPVQQNDKGTPNAVVVKGQTLAQDGLVLTIDGNPVAYSAGSVYVANSATPVLTKPPAQQQQNPTAFAVGGYTFTPVQQSNQGAPKAVFLPGQTLQGNGPAVTIGGSNLAYSGSVYIGNQDAPVPTPPSQPNFVPAVISSYTFVPVQPSGTGSSKAVVIQGQTLQENAPAVTIGGDTLAYSSGSVYVGSNGAAISTTLPQQGNLNPTVINGMTFTPVAQPNIQAAPTPIPTPTPIIIAGITASAGPHGEVILGGQTIASNAPQVTVAGIPVSLGPSGLVVGSSTIKLASVPTQPALATVGGQLITSAGFSGGFAVAGTTLTPGGAAVTISGTPISLGIAGLVIGTSTIPVHEIGKSVFTVAGQMFTANPSGFVLAPGTTLTPGGAGSISGTVISLAVSGVNLVIGSSTIFLPPQSVFTIGSQTFTANPTGFLLAPGTTLSPGGPAVTLSGTIVSLASKGDLIIGSKIISLPPAQLSIFTIADRTFTASPSGFEIAPGTTLLPGNSLTLSGTLVSLASNGAELLIGKEIFPLLSPIPPAAATTKLLPTLTINGQLVPADVTAGVYRLGGNQTLVPGGSALTISGTLISLAPGGHLLVVGGGTRILGNETLVGGGTAVGGSGNTVAMSTTKGFGGGGGGGGGGGISKTAAVGTASTGSGARIIGLERRLLMVVVVMVGIFWS